MPKLTFDNRFVNDLPGDTDKVNWPRQVYDAFWSQVKPTTVAQPTIIAYAPETAALLDLNSTDMENPAMAAILAAFIVGGA